MYQPVMSFMPSHLWTEAIRVVSEQIRKLENAPSNFEVKILWFAWFLNGCFVSTPAQSWRAVAVSSNMGKGVYFEVSYDHVSNAYYVDTYESTGRTVFPSS